MKKALIGFGLAIVLMAGLMGFSQVGEEKKSLCTVRGYGPLSVKDIKGIYIYEGHESVKKIAVTSNENFDYHAQLHKELQNLYDEGWVLVSSNASGINNLYLEYNLQK